jgi:hypothetical protein
MKTHILLLFFFFHNGCTNLHYPVFLKPQKPCSSEDTPSNPRSWLQQPQSICSSGSPCISPWCPSWGGPKPPISHLCGGTPGSFCPSSL